MGKGRELAYNSPGMEISFIWQNANSMAKKEIEEAFPEGTEITYEQAVQYFAKRKDDYIKFKENLQKDELLEYLKRDLPDVVIPEDKIEERKALIDKYAQNVWMCSLERNLALKLYPMKDRTLSGMLIPSLDPEDNRKNIEYHKAMSLPDSDPTKKAKVGKYLTERLEEIGNTNLKDIDMSTDEKFVDNYKRIFILRVSCDMQNVAKDLEKYVDFTAPELEKFCKLSTYLDSVFTAAGTLQNFLGTDMAEYTDLRKLPNGFDYPAHERYLQNTFDNITIDSAFANFNTYHQCEPIFDTSLTLPERVEETLKNPVRERSLDLLNSEARKAEKAKAARNRALAEEIANRRVIPDDVPDSYFDDKIAANLKILRREYGFNNEYDRAYFENPPIPGDFGNLSQADGYVANICTAYLQKVEYTKLLRAGAFENETDIYSKFSDANFNNASAELKNDPGFKRALAEMTQEEYNDFCLGRGTDIERFINQKVPAARKAYNREIENDTKAYLRAKAEANFEAIKSVIPGFEYTEDDIDAMVSEERIAMHRRAKEKIEDSDRRLKISHEFTTGSIPAEFARIASRFADSADTEEARQHNRSLFDRFNETSREGDSIRKVIFIETLNRANEINPADYAGDKTEAELFELSMRDYDKGYLAWACGDLKNTSEFTGFTLNSEAFEKFENQRSKLNGLGTVPTNYVKRLGIADNFAIPFDKITPEMVGLLVTSKNPLAKNIGIAAAEMNNTKTEMESYSRDSDFSGRVYGVDDLKNTLPDGIRIVRTVGDLAEKLDAFRKDLKDARKLISLYDSQEYTDLVASLDRAVAACAVDAPIGNRKAQEVYECLLDVDKKASAYEKEKRNQDKNENRQKRYDTAVKIKQLCVRLLDDGVRPASCMRSPRFLKFNEQHNAMYTRNGLNAKDYYNSVKQGSRLIDGELNAGAEKLALYREAAAITEDLRFKEQGAPKSSRYKHLLGKMVRARDVLHNELDKRIEEENYDKTKIFRNIGTVIACRSLMRNEPPENLRISQINKAIEDVSKSELIEEMFKNINVDKLNDFLANENAIDRYCDEYAQRLAHERENRINNVNRENEHDAIVNNNNPQAGF